ncbi:MAG: cupin domain-containing protein [Acidimicrobiales bacterium]
MTARAQRAQSGHAPSRAELAQAMRAEGLAPHAWSSGPGEGYGWHDHTYAKVLYCVSGSITFHTGAGDVALSPGDRLELDPPPGRPA